MNITLPNRDALDEIINILRKYGITFDEGGITDPYSEDDEAYGHWIVILDTYLEAYNEEVK